MQLTVCGFGGAGSRLADRLVAESETGGEPFVVASVAFDTDPATLAELEWIPAPHRHHYGDGVLGTLSEDDFASGEFAPGGGSDDSADEHLNGGETADAAATAVNDTAADTVGDTGGAVDDTGGDMDRQQGAAAVESAHTALSQALTDAISTQADGVLCCVGLAGATGATAVPPLVSELQRVHDLPVYCLGLLPAETVEADGVASDRGGAGRTDRRSTGSAAFDPSGAERNRSAPAGPPTWAVNTGRALEELTVATDSVILFDNALWMQSDESIRDDDVRRRLNDAVATRVASVFRAGEVGTDDRMAQQVVDAADLMNTLDAGGVATIGYASQTVETGDRSRFGLGLFTTEQSVEDTAAIKAVETTVRRAARGKLTVDIERDSVSRGLLVIGGPPEWLNRQAVSHARRWLTDETATVQLRSGDRPVPDGNAVTAVVLLTGVEECDRVDAMRSAAEQARRL